MTARGSSASPFPLPGMVRRGKWEAGRVFCMALAALSMLLVPGAPAQQVTSEPPAVGDDPAFDARARAIAVQIRCPVCLGNSVEDSPSELAREMRQLVREQLAAGKSEAEVKQYFVDRYGEWVLLNPKAEGFNLVVWVLPFLMLAGGGVGVWIAVRKWAAAGAQGRSEAANTPAASHSLPPSEDDAYLRRVRDEVARGKS